MTHYWYRMSKKLKVSIERPITLVWKLPYVKVRIVLKSSDSQLSYEHKKRVILCRNGWENCNWSGSMKFHFYYCQITVTFNYHHVFLNISDNFGPNLISRDITGKKRTRAFIWRQYWWGFRLYCCRYRHFLAAKSSSTSPLWVSDSKQSYNVM